MLRKLPDDISADPLVKRMRANTSADSRHSYSIRGLDDRLFFILLLIYHVAVTFQGIDLLDEGFHAVFYQRIFNDPLSVQYSFFYWFSGITGGLILKAVPSLGLWGLRIAGALVSTGTILVVYRLLKKIMPRGILQVSIVILALYINTEPKDIHYNTISALLFFSSAAIMFSGLTRARRILLFFSGLLLALNVFTRLPNILGVGMGLVIIYDGYLQHHSRKNILTSLSIFIAGFLVSFFSILVIMNYLGHLGIFIDSIKFLFSLTTTTGKQDGLAGSYGIGRLVYVLVKQHGLSALLVILLASVTILYKFLSNTIVNIGSRHFRISNLMICTCSAGMLWLIISGRIELNDLTYLFTGISVISAFVYITGKYTRTEKLLSALGAFIMLVHPFGSAPGILTVMLYSFWINFPMAVSMLGKLAGKDLEFHFRAGRDGCDLFIQRNTFFKRMLHWMAAVILVLCLHQLLVFPYFYDRHYRMEMTYGIDNANTRFIYTSKARALAINELLEASHKLIKEDDPVLAYDAIPLYHFMTETRPFLPNSTPMFYTNQQFEAELAMAVKRKGLPAIVQQRIWTIHEGSGWPEDIRQNNNMEETLNNGRNLAFYQFLKTNNYEVAWSNEVFRILVPTDKKNIK
jgi:hypothetical protein